MSSSFINKVLASALIVAGAVVAQADEVYMVADFEDCEIGQTFRMRINNGVGTQASTATVEADPDDASNKVLHIVQSNSIAVVELPLGEMTLGEASASYDVLEFDYRRISGEDYQCFTVYSGTKKFYGDPNYYRAGDVGAWILRPYFIEEQESDENVLAIGYQGSGKKEYYIDNVRFRQPDYGYDSTDPEQTLRYWAGLIGKDIGSCISTNQIKADDMQAKAFYRNYNMVVSEWEMKMASVEPKQNEFDFSAGDEILEFAEKHDMKLRGHCLCWHESIPSWVSKDGYANDKNWTKSQLLAILKKYVTETAGHWKGRVVEWDVVNECLSDDQSSVDVSGGKYVMRNNIWYKVIGECYLDSAFKWAHEADPDAVLYLNDYGVESWNQSKTEAMYNLVKKLQKRHVPIDGVGLQSHFTLGYQDSTEIEKTVRRYDKLGLKVKFTEINIAIPEGQLGKASAWNNQAKEYGMLARIMTAYDCCTGMISWGINDYRGQTAAVTKGEDFMLGRYYGAKPAYFAVRTALKNKYMTGVMAVPQSKLTQDVYDAQGRIVARGLKVNEILTLPAGLYISDGHKYLVR